MNIQHLIRNYAATIEIKQNLTLINRAVHNLEPRFTARVLRTLTGLRKKLYREALQEVVNDLYPKSQSSPLLNRYIEMC
jgi:26S proteasome regulatory subunit N3